MIPPKPRDTIELTTRDLSIVSAPPDDVRPAVIVGVAVHSPARDLSRCLRSIAEQNMDEARLGVVVLLDSPRTESFCPPIPAKLRDRAWLLRANCGSPARARNTILEFVEKQLPSCRWVARLDWDDRFAEPDSLGAGVATGELADARFVVGGNRVLDREGRCLRTNPAGCWLRDKTSLLDRLSHMADGTAVNELPSCNLILRTDAGIRYPDTASAEDHWLVADLLMHDSQHGAILESIFFADYTLNGHCTSNAKHAQRHHAARRALCHAAQTWFAASEMPGRVLGLGQEGIVREHDGTVFKHFYPGILSLQKVQWFDHILAAGQSIVPAARFTHEPESDTWTATYAWVPTQSFESPSEAAVEVFLAECLRHKLVCGNIKRSNFRVRADGRLLYIDIGNWIVPMDVSILRDSAARLYSIGVLGSSDDELLRRAADHSRPVIWERLPGFSEFYGHVVTRHITSQWPLTPHPDGAGQTLRRRSDVTLLIKACAMDADYAAEQVRHIVRQLVGPIDFAQRVLVIDPHRGPFLRQHAPGDLKALLTSADSLCAEGTLDRVMVAQSDAATVSAVNHAWFGLESSQTHSAEGIPVSPQLWAFDQLSTRYVLQCDVDVLVGRRDRNHDYLSDMVAACESARTVGVAFNIPHDPASPAQPYDAPPGEYKPEVRCGLLDLQRLRNLRPLPNRLVSGRLEQPWYRSLHECQRQRALRTLRGGSPSTFYIHPLNSLKSDQDALARVRDLVAQGIVPKSHWDRWDVGPDATDWNYPSRSEPVVILARGRNTPRDKIDRFAAGLAMQDDQGFGVIVIDDASDDASPEYLHKRLHYLGSRLTLVRHHRRRGRMCNSILALRELCDNPDSRVAMVDLDDALADPGAIRGVRSLRDRGHDVVLAAPFRPDMPTKVYQPDFRSPRDSFGGDVWIHLRAFAKRLFDCLPNDALQIDGAWLQECEDYATMIPMVEMASSPVYVPQYWYWHERTTGRDPEERSRRDMIIQRLLSKPSHQYPRTSRSQGASAMP